MRALPTLDDVGHSDTPTDHSTTDPLLHLTPAVPPSASTTEILRALRAAYPHSPLALRVRALAALRRR